MPMHKIYDTGHWGRTCAEVWVILVLILTQCKIRTYFIPLTSVLPSASHWKGPVTATCTVQRWCEKF